MDIRKSFFGGYKRKDVDQLVGRLTDTGNAALARITILEKEIEGLRQSAKTDLELISQDAEAGRRRNNDLKTQIETAGRQAEESRKQIAGKDSLILQLEEKCRQADRSAEAYDAKIRQIGEIYAEALEYSRRLKEDTKKDIAEIVNTIFDEMLQPDRSVRADPGQTDHYRGALNDIAQELEETSAFLKNSLEKLNSTAAQRPFSHDTLGSARDRLTDKIRNGSGQGGSRGAAPDLNTSSDQEVASPGGRPAADTWTLSRSSADAAASEALMMPGQLEINMNNEEEEDRHKYQQTFNEIGAIKQDDVLPGHDPVPPADAAGANPEYRYSEIREDAAVSVPKKTSIREILEKYSKF
ncbi:MAG: hypothetical protein ACYCYM_09315 [Saccharofermentanales bacterium]